MKKATIVEKIKKTSQRIIMEGSTGSGKTYSAIHQADKLGSYIYTAPCRQLVYETAIKYGTEDDTISTGELHIGGKKNIFCVYESCDENMIDKHDTLIIDEAHFLTDSERGGHLSELMEYASQQNKHIFLVTATRNFSKINGFKIKKLKSKFEKKIIKRRITFAEFTRREAAGEPSITFMRYKRMAWLYKNAITADTDAPTRLKYQLDFAAGRIKSIAATNVLAQGLNFPATNVLIEYNPYDDNEIIQQKIGRLGRFGMCDQNAILTYCLVEKPGKIKKNKKIITKNQRDLFDVESWIKDNLGIGTHNLILESIKRKFSKAFRNAHAHEHPSRKYGAGRVVHFFDSLTESEKKEFSELREYLFDDFLEIVEKFKKTENELKKLIQENLRGKNNEPQTTTT